MTDGRVFTLEDEIDVLHEDLGRARRDLESVLRAPYDRRWCGSPEDHDEAVAAATAKVLGIERAIAEANMAQQAALDAQDAGT